MKLVPLTQGLFAQVDDEDFNRVMQFKWSAMRSANQHRIYAVNQGKARGDGRAKTRKAIQLQEFIIGRNWQDHINGDGLDCQRKNLRDTSCLQNLANARKTIRKTRSQYKGIHLRKKDLRWVASVGSLQGLGKKYLGSYATEVEAALAYDRGARTMYGEFARCNFGPGELL